MNALSGAELARYIDHTLVRPEATREDITRICLEAREYGFHGVCVNGAHVELAYSLLEDTIVKVTGMVGYPLGASDPDAKRYETEVAIDQGAHEIEMVLNVGRLREGDQASILRELRDIAEAADERPVKVILETRLLSINERRLACELALDSGVHYVCTNTGLGSDATWEEVAELRLLVGEKLGVKACGGIMDLQKVLALIEAGATRLGTSQGTGIMRSVPK